MIKVGDKVYIIQEGLIYGKKAKNCVTILQAVVDFVTSTELVVKVQLDADQIVLIPVQFDQIATSPQKALETISSKVMNVIYNEEPKIVNHEN